MLVSVGRMKTSAPSCRLDPGQTIALAALNALALNRTFNVGVPIYVYGDRAEFWYRILTGGARMCAFTLDGNRHVVDFLRPGDLFGVDARDTHEFSAEPIISGTTVARYRRETAERLADSDPNVAKIIRKLAFDSTFRAHRRAVILGRATALAKVGHFLLEMTDSYIGQRSEVVLPSRYDMADYLALAVETVSRALTTLREKGVIRFSSIRRVQICDRRALEWALKRNATQTAGHGWHESVPLGTGRC